MYSDRVTVEVVWRNVPPDPTARIENPTRCNCREAGMGKISKCAKPPLPKMMSMRGEWMLN